MQYCVILEVQGITDATAVGMLLQRSGYKIVSAQVTPSNCPLQEKASNYEGCPAVAKPSAPTAKRLGAKTMNRKRKVQCISSPKGFQNRPGTGAVVP